MAACLSGDGLGKNVVKIKSSILDGSDSALEKCGERLRVIHVPERWSGSSNAESASVPVFSQNWEQELAV